MTCKSVTTQGTKPSIVAVVGSLDPSATVYDCKIRIQESGQNEEIIHDMRAITKQLLLKFYRTNCNNSRNGKPNRIIMYRWGLTRLEGCGTFFTVFNRCKVYVKFLPSGLKWRGHLEFFEDLMALQTAEAIVPGSNPSSLTVEKTLRTGRVTVCVV